MILVPIFGPIPNPFTGSYACDINQVGQAACAQFGLIAFLNNVLKLVIVIAGLFAFFQFLVAGFDFLSAGGDSKKITGAWAKIWQSIIGLVFVAGAFVLAAIFGYLIFGDPTIILNPPIWGPTP